MASSERTTSQPGSGQTPPTVSLSGLRVRWAAIGAAIAITLGAGTIATVDATQTSGERLTYVATEPCRLIDTRPEPQFNVGPRTAPLGPRETLTINARGAQGQCTAAQLPTNATALALNITVPFATSNGFLTVWGEGTRPNASSLNPAPAQPPAPNSVTSTLSNTGTFNIYNENGSTHVIVDVVGHHLDHNHDDRYDTKAQAEARVEANIANPDTGPEVIDLGAWDMSVSIGSTFTFNAGLSLWTKTSGSGCLVAPVDLVPGQRAESVSFTFRKSGSAPVEARVSLAGLETRPTASTFILPTSHSTLFEDVTVTGVAQSRVEPIADQSIGNDRTIRPGYAYVAQICTSAAGSVQGARVILSNP